MKTNRREQTTKASADTRLVFSFFLFFHRSPLDETRRIELIREMSTWNFQPHKLSVDDLYHCTCILFEATLSMEGLWELEIPLGEFSSRPSSPSLSSFHTSQLTYPFLSHLISPRSNPPLPLLRPIDLPRSEPLPQLETRRRRPPSIILVPRCHRSRSLVRLPSYHSIRTAGTVVEEVANAWEREGGESEGSLATSGCVCVDGGCDWT